MKDYLITIPRLGYEIRTVLWEVEDGLSDDAIIKMAKTKFVRYGVELKNDDTFDLDYL
jgi:hypothetical protein